MLAPRDALCSRTALTSASMKGKREREEACSICGHYHDVSTSDSGRRVAHVARSPPPRASGAFSVLIAASLFGDAVHTCSSARPHPRHTQTLHSSWCTLCLALQYEGGEPCKVCGHVLAVSTAGRPETVMPTTVVPGFLYLGR